jgi:hypothetical protein
LEIFIACGKGLGVVLAGKGEIVTENPANTASLTNSRVAFRLLRDFQI